MNENGLVSLNQFVDTLGNLIIITLGVTIVAFIIVAYIVCKIHDKKE